MKTKRRWKAWPKRIIQELNGVAGLMAVGGILIGAAAWSLLPGTTATALIVVGLVICIPAFGYAVIKAVPGRLNSPQDMVGQTIPLAQLGDIVPPVQTLAIIGLTQAGKSTLRNSLAFGIESGRTQQATAHIVALQTSPPKYIAVLDGDGTVYAQQFEIARRCDMMCIVVDHNSSNSDPTVHQERLREHAAFLSQIRDYLDQEPGTEKKWIHFLLNKRDLWQLASPDQQSMYESFCETELRLWQAKRRAGELNFAIHSNSIPLDVAQFMNRLKDKA